MGYIPKQCITRFKGAKTHIINQVGFLSLVHFPSNSCMGCGVHPPPPNVITKVEKDENIVDLI
jgi:hypothetical protein